MPRVPKHNIRNQYQNVNYFNLREIGSVAKTRAEHDGTLSLLRCPGPPVQCPVHSIFNTPYPSWTSVDAHVYVRTMRSIQYRTLTFQMKRKSRCAPNNVYEKKIRFTRDPLY